MLRKLVTLTSLTMMAAVALAVPVMVSGSAKFLIRRDHAKGIYLNRSLVAVNATPAADLCDCPYYAVGWTFIHRKCTCESPVNRTSGLRDIPVIIESQNKRDAPGENNIDFDHIEERSLGCRFHQCDYMMNPVKQNGVCVCVAAPGTDGWKRDTATPDEFDKKSNVALESTGSFNQKRDVSMEVDASKPNGQIRVLKGRGNPVL